MVALESYWTDKGAVADGTHEMVVVAGDVVQRAEVDGFAAGDMRRLHLEEFLQVHVFRAVRGVSLALQKNRHSKP